MIVWGLAVIVCVLKFYWWFVLPLSYWKKRGIPYLKAYPIVGNLLGACLRIHSFTDDTLYHYKAMPEKKLYGTFFGMAPVLLIRDLELLRKIMIKDFDHFTDHSDAVHKYDPVFRRTLFALKGDQWRQMRTVLSPAFTSSKLKMMLDAMKTSGEQVKINYLRECRERANGEAFPVDLKNMFSRYTNDIITTVAFGINTNSFTNAGNILFRMGLQATTFEMWRLFVLSTFPIVTKVFTIGLLPTTIYDFFKNIIQRIVETRQRDKIVRHDMINLLMEASEETFHRDKQIDANTPPTQPTSAKRNNCQLTKEDFIAQGFIFFLAGFDTVASTTSFAAYELALNSKLQKRLQAEIDFTLSECGENLTMPVITEMVYLDMVVSETLRKWPAVVTSNRQVSKPYTLDLDDQLIKLDIGMSINIPIFGIHRDPRYFPNPDIFDPERFNTHNKRLIAPLTFLPFGLGPRNCIGGRFSLLEIKVALIYLLANFDLVPTTETKEPIVLQRGSLNLAIENGFWVGLKEREMLNISK